MSTYHVLLLFLVKVHVISAFMYQNGVVLPIDPYVYIGDNLTLTCNLTRALDEDSRSMFFTRKANELIPAKYVRILSTRSIRLQLPMKADKDGGNYVCKMKKANGDVEVISNQFVEVEYYPQKVKNISCRVYNWQSMVCSWSLGVKYVHPDNIKVELVWAVSGDLYQYDCPRMTNSSCTWVKDATKDRFRVDMVYTMAIVVTNNRTNGNRTTAQATSKTFQIDTSKIVQPAPVTQLEYSSNSTCVSLTWNHSAVLHRKIYRIQFNGEQDISEGRNTEVQEQFYTVCGLRPHTWYKVKVACRPLHWDNTQTGFWSEEMAKWVMTKEDVPGGAPQVLEGSYSIHPCDLVNCRNVVIYWKHVDAQERNGDITKYRLTRKDLSTLQVVSHELGNITHGDLSLDMYRSYQIQIQAATQAGFSQYTGKLIIPSKANEPPYPQDFLVEFDSDEKSGKQWLDIQWNPPSHIKRRIVSYTLYWCQGDRNTQRCKTQIDWKILPKTFRQYKMPVNKNELTRTLYGISVEVEVTRDVKYSSGITWSDCIYIKNSKPGIAPRNFRVAPVDPQTSVKVEWDPVQCQEALGYINKFNIYYCLINEDKNCTGNMHRKEAAGGQLSMVISDLDYGLQYMFWMDAESDGGKGPQTLPIFANIPPSELQPEEIGGIAVGVVFVFSLAMCGVICCVKRCYQTVKQKFKPYEIVVPNISLPSIPMPQSSPTETKVTEQDVDEDEDDNESIYAKIDGDDNLSDPSTPGSTSVDAPLLNKSIPPMLSKSQLYYESPKTKKKSQLLDNFGNSDYNSNLRNNMEAFLSRLNHNPGLTDSRGKRRLPYMGVRVPVSSTRGVKYAKKPSSDPNLLADNCSPYSCVDIINMDTKSEKVCRKLSNPCEKVIHSEGSMYCDPSYEKTNDLSMAPARSQPLIPSTWRDQLENNVPQQYNIRHSLDRRKDAYSDCCNHSVVSNDLNDLNSSAGVDINTEDSGLPKYVPDVEMNVKSGSSDISSHPVTSYCKLTTENYNHIPLNVSDNPQTPCSRTPAVSQAAPTPSGYVGHDQLPVAMTAVQGTVDGISGQRPVSEVVNLPPHFYGSLSLLDDDGTVTEL